MHQMLAQRPVDAFSGREIERLLQKTVYRRKQLGICSKEHVFIGLLVDSTIDWIYMRGGIANDALCVDSGSRSNPDFERLIVVFENRLRRPISMPAVLPLARHIPLPR